MEEIINCPNCDTFIGDTVGMDVCPVCGCALVGDWHKDFPTEEEGI